MADQGRQSAARPALDVRASDQVEPRRAAIYSTTAATRVGALDQASARAEREEAATGPSPALQATLATMRIGRFVLLRELGRGAMGVVFAAYDGELDRRVAIKLLHTDRRHDESNGRAMLLREAQAMARLAHPNVVAIHEVGVVEGAVFAAMEYVPGVDLQEWLAEKPRPWREVVAVMRQAGAGLVAAHRQGLIHRDFKPSNVLVGDDDRVRVADFGLAAHRDADANPIAELAHVEGLMMATLGGEGMLVGTPAYMAPELLHNGSATARSDQYAFCVALYEALHGARPFNGSTVATLIEDVGRRTLPTTPPRADVPVWLHAAVCRGLARAPDDRFASLAELVDLLAQDPEAEAVQRRRRLLQFAGAIAGTVALVTLAVLAYGALRRYAAERQAEDRLTALREQIAELRAKEDPAAARRLLQTFVALPENRGLAIVARAYNEWAAAQADHAEATDAYASAYIAARGEVDGRVALRGLIDRLSAQGQVSEAAAALAVLARTAPDEAAAPELQPVRLASALSQRDLPAARAVLEGRDPDDWGHVFKDLAKGTEIALDRFAGEFRPANRLFEVVDLDGDGTRELMSWATDGTMPQLFRADASLTPLGTIEVGAPKWVGAIEAAVAGEPMLLAAYPTDDPQRYELRLLDVRDHRAPRTIDSWLDSFAFRTATLDFDGDGRRELFIGTGAYTRKFWRLDRAEDGGWTRSTAHAATEAAASDVSALAAADLDGDGRSELVAAVGPWKAYDLRVFKPTPAGELELVARREFGMFGFMRRMRAPGTDLVVFSKLDTMVSPGRFAAERPMGEPAGLYFVGLRDGALAVLGHVPAQTASGKSLHFHQIHVGDLDGDGQDEAVVEIVVDLEQRATMVLRWRDGALLPPQRIEGMHPLFVADVDGDADAEILVETTDAPRRLFMLGSGSTPLPALPRIDREPRPIPPGIADPVIAEAWTHAEQLAAIGLPRRTADELSTIARLSGHVAPDMFLRTAELYAGLGDDARAAEQFVAAADRPDLAPAALAGAAAARRRLGEFAAAEALTRERLEVVGEGERVAVAAELAALTEATAARPELALSFTRPLDPRWRIADPTAVRRVVTRGALSVWATRTPVVAEFPLVWDGGPARLELELEADRLEWGTEISIAVMGSDPKPWMFVTIGGFGVTEQPTTHVGAGKEPYSGDGHVLADGATVRARSSLYPGFKTAIHEVDSGTDRWRVVETITSTSLPPAGPLRLCVLSKAIEPTFVGHVWIRSIGLTGFTAGEVPIAVDPAWLQAEGELAAATRALRPVTPGSERQVWLIDALLGLGELDAASTEMRSLLAAVPETDPVYAALRLRLRRSDEAGWLAARAAFGPRLIDLLLEPAAATALRAADIDHVLTSLPATDPAEAPKDPAAQRRLVLVDFARGEAFVQAGRFAAAREAFAAAFTRVSAATFPDRDRLHARLIGKQLELAGAIGDRAAARQWIEVALTTSKSPYLAIERMPSETALAELFGADEWGVLKATLADTRP